MTLLSDYNNGATVGSLLPVAHSAPNGYLMADGVTYLKSDYPNLAVTLPPKSGLTIASNSSTYAGTVVSLSFSGGTFLRCNALGVDVSTTGYTWTFHAAKVNGVSALQGALYTGSVYYVYGNGVGVIASSSDNFTTLVTTTDPVLSTLYCHSMDIDLATNTIVAVGSLSKILTSTNGGTTWVDTSPNTVGALYAVKHTPIGWFALGSSGLLYKSTDGAATWVLMPAPKNVTLESICYTGSSLIVTTSTANEYYRSIDGGATWVIHSTLGLTSYLILYHAVSDGAGTVLFSGTYSSGVTNTFTVVSYDGGTTTEFLDIGYYAPNLTGVAYGVGMFVGTPNQAYSMWNTFLGYDPLTHFRVPSIMVGSVKYAIKY